MTEDIRGIESQVVNIYPELSYETFEGFGGAVTEAAGYIYSLMNDEQKKKVQISAPYISCPGSDADGMAGIPSSGSEDSGSDPGGS